jgi:biopolymer transport protein ExbB/TolQ
MKSKTWQDLQGLISLSAALVATVLTFLLVALLAPKASYLHALFLERSWIQYGTTFAFWLTIAVLAVMHVSSHREVASLAAAREILKSQALEASFIWSDAAMVRGHFAEPQHARFRHSITFSRILNALDRLRKSQSTSAAEEYFRTRSDHDATTLETSYAGIRYFVWLLPTLGLIGTVLGLGRGMSKFGGIIENADNFLAIKKALPEVTNNLGTAFDATFLAIFLSAVAAFYMSFLQKRQEHILEEIDNLCIDDVCALFQEHSTGSTEIVRALTEQVQLVIRATHGNRAQIEKHLEMLPDALARTLQSLATSALNRLDDIARATARSTH